MHKQSDVREVTELTSDRVKVMSQEELLSAVWTAESLYRSEESPRAHDHRRFLERDELENVFYLVQQVVRRRRGRSDPE
jgi:hypothetical protein